MRQRVGLAQALIGQPQLMVLDEPTSGLDPVSRLEFYEILDGLAATGTAILLSSHALTEVEARTDRIVILSGGKLMADDTLATLRRTTPQVILVGGAAGDNSVVLCCARLAAETMGTVPVIAITDPQDRVRALRAGASAAMDRPVDESLLLARIRGLVRDGQGMLPVAGPLPVGGGAFQPIGLAEAAAAFAGPGAGAADLQGAEIVLVGQAGAGSLLWRRAVQARLNVSVRFCEADRALSDAAQGRAADLYLIAGGGGGGAAGLQLMSELRSRPASREASIVVLLPADRTDLASVALDLGANDVLSDPPDPDHEEEIALRIAAQLRRKRTADRSRQAAARDRRWAWTDPLTDLPNRRHFLARME